MVKNASSRADSGTKRRLFGRFKKSAASNEYIYDYKGTVVDISSTTKAGLVKENVLLYELDHFFRSSHGCWSTQVRFHPAAVAKAAS